MLYSVYAIKSEANGFIYVGLSQDVARRLKDHNTKRVRSTKAYTPWKLFYQKEIGQRSEARKYEKYLKSGCGKEFLRALLNSN